MGGKLDRRATRIGDRERARAIAERGDHQVGPRQMRARDRVLAAGDLVAGHARLGHAAVDPQHPQHQFARLEPEPAEAIDETADRADIVRAEIGEALCLCGLDRRIEGPQGRRCISVMPPAPNGIARAALEQQRDRRQRAGRPADHHDPGVAFAGEQVADLGESALRQHLVGLEQPVAGGSHQGQACDALAGKPIERLIATRRDHQCGRKPVELQAVGQPPEPAAPQAFAGAFGTQHFMPGQHRAAIGRDDTGQPVACRAQQQPCLDQGHAKRSRMTRDRAAHRMIRQSGNLRMPIVLYRAQEGLGGAVRIDRVTPEPAAAERIVALHHHQPRSCQIGQQPALCRGSQQRRAGRSTADHQHRGDRVGARRGGDTPPGLSRANGVEGLSDNDGVFGAHRVGDRQRDHAPGDGIGGRGRFDHRGRPEQGLLADMRAEIAPGADTGRVERRRDRIAARGERLGQHQRHELGRAAASRDMLQRDLIERFAIGRFQGGARIADQVDLGELRPRHHRQYFGQLGVEPHQRRAAPALEAEIGHRAERRDQFRIAAVDQPPFGDREGLGRVHRIDHGKRRIGAEAIAGIVDRAERSCGIDDDPDAVPALQPRIAIEIDRIAEGRIGHDHRDPVAIVAEQSFLCRRTGAPVERIHVADERRQPGPQRRLGRRGKGERRHQRKPARRHDRTHCFADRDHQSRCRVGDGKAGALPTEQPLGHLGLERPHDRTVVAEHAPIPRPGGAHPAARSAAADWGR